MPTKVLPGQVGQKRFTVRTAFDGKKAAIDPDLLHVCWFAAASGLSKPILISSKLFLCGRRRIENDRVEALRAAELVRVCNADSFGRYHRLSKKGEACLLAFSFHCRKNRPVTPPVRPSFAFVMCESCGQRG